MQSVDNKINDWRFLTSHLIRRLSSRKLSCVLLLVYHLVVLIMPQIKIGFAIFSMFIFIIAYKISILDKFMRDLKKVANDFRMDPDRAQEECDKLMMKDNSGNFILNDPK